MQQLSGEAIFDRFQYLQGQRQTLSWMWEDLARFTDPQRADVLTQRTLGDKRPSPLDITACKAVDNLAFGIYSTVLNPGDQWFSLRSTYPEINEILEVSRWFEKSRNLMMMKMSADGNRFYSQIGGMLKDLVVFGTAIFYVEEVSGTDKIIFRCFHPKNVFIESNNLGVIDVVVRKFTLTARSAKMEFGDAVSDKINHAYDKNPNTQFEFLHFVGPVMDGKYQTVKKGKPFCSYFVESGTKKIVKEGGYYEMPYQTPRWSVRGEFDYGESPTWNALASIKMINKMKQLTIEGGESVLRPAILAVDELATRGNYEVRPGKLLYGALRPDGTPMMRPLMDGSQPNFGIDMMNMERDDINAAFYRDALLMSQDADRTATEALIIQEERQKTMSYFFGQLQNELLNPLVNRVFHIMLRTGGLSNPPKELLQFPSFEIEYVSPLARSQKTSRAASTLRSLQSVIQFAQVDPSIVDNINLDNVAREIPEMMGVLPSLLRSREEVVELRAQRAQQEQAAQMAAAAEPLSKAAKNVAETQNIAGSQAA